LTIAHSDHGLGITFELNYTANPLVPGYPES
jgi:hypothetical protein